MTYKFITASATLFLSALLSFSVFTEESNTLSISNDLTTNNLAQSMTDHSNGIPELQPQIEDQYYHDALKSLEPLTPEQIKNIRQKLNLLDQAKVAPITEINPITRSIDVSLRSGENPFNVKISPGWVSTLTFSDRTGQSWPIQNVTNGNPEIYDVFSSGPDGTSNIITISAKQAHIPSNLAILLQGATVPLLITLTPSQGTIDYRIDVRVDQRGPNATPENLVTSTLAPTSDSTILSFLDGVVPPQARSLSVLSHLKLDAWIYDKLLYVRTNVNLLSPAFTAKHSNASGIKVYVLKPTPVLLVSDHGNTFFAKIDIKN